VFCFEFDTFSIHGAFGFPSCFDPTFLFVMAEVFLNYYHFVVGSAISYVYECDLGSRIAVVDDVVVQALVILLGLFRSGTRNNLVME
jgi:hypothetical protein